ncbi:MAG: hypothetical protein KZQ65_06430, partial [Candidatus Thiodiazotropha sp. (ex Gloverina cf. vestifex)]|nr:hypothetical protein [Candidatus Thiodiazotropha sp. (ex Gloverina cf. vestifex)]
TVTITAIQPRLRLSGTNRLGFQPSMAISVRRGRDRWTLDCTQLSHGLYPLPGALPGVCDLAATQDLAGCKTVISSPRPLLWQRQGTAPGNTLA